MKGCSFRVFNAKNLACSLFFPIFAVVFMRCRQYAEVRMLVSYTTNSKIFTENSSNLLIKSNNNGR